ncbi:MAG: type I-U CRISPR-associated protein Cas5/Cas6 [Labilithrix sp.]|nr:type I-U CRISPR-associated protein Cas5/Cas6 [Labilithrix sp.]MCW5816356.1 type I-U CRISPR-associated protein Cas5/Cas6 [Labilithrix sp.]
MPTLLLRFPGGRYHATPHGHHVNEALVEWPPSPWRLVRAIIAAGYATQRWSQVPAEGRELIEALASTLPRYRLPLASIAHSRHYMPMATLEKGREKTSLVFDAWADVGDGVVAVCWDCALGERARETLGAIARDLPYLGRSESWVEGELVSDDAISDGFDVRPHVDGMVGERGWEQIALLAPVEAVDYQRWREERVTHALASQGIPVDVPSKSKPSKKLEKARAAAVAPYPIDLVDCLQRDTSWWKIHGWSQPPGSRRVLYWRQREALAVTPSPTRPRPSRREVTSALLALSTPSGNRGALPSVARTLPQAELVHRALVSRVDGRAPELTGRDTLRRPLRGHGHAHVLPVDLDADGGLDHVLIFARMGLGSVAQRGIQGLERTWTKGGVGELRVALVGEGTLDDLRAIPEPLGRGVERLLGPREGARRWTSVTPTVLPRFVKSKGKNSWLEQVREELSSRGFPRAEIEMLPWDAQTLHLRHFVRVRRPPAAAPPKDLGLALRLVFDEPVRGPIAIGYASHFGLGVFGAEPS